MLPLTYFTSPHFFKMTEILECLKMSEKYIKILDLVGTAVTALNP